VSLSVDVRGGGGVSVLALAWSALGRTVEKAAVRWSRVLVSVVPACPMGMATNSILSQYFLSAVTRKQYFFVFFISLLTFCRIRGLWRTESK